MATRDEVAKILALLAATYPRYQLTKETIAAYAQLLEDIPAETLKAAALKCATEGAFFPSVHELRQSVIDIKRMALGLPDTYTAWHDVSTGPRAEFTKSLNEEDGKFYIVEEPRQWSHPFVEHVAKLLGWPNDFPGDNPGVDRAHFFRAYEDSLAKELSDANRLPSLVSHVQKEQKLLEVKNDRTGRSTILVAKNG